jgi:protein SCO1/2
MKRVSRITDRFVFLCSLALLSWGLGDRPQAVADDPPKAESPRAAYFPKVTLKTQDGKDVSFYMDLVKGKIVVINFMYTRCEGKRCGEGTKNLVNLQKALGKRLGKEVFMYSITLDPEHDTPEELKEYAMNYGAKWTFLTGKAEDITTLRRKLGLSNPDPKKDEDRTQHSGMIVIGNDALDKWTTAAILASPDRILQIIERMKPPKVPEK